VDKVERHRLKHNKFEEQVWHQVEVVSEHKSQVYRYGAIALAVVLAIAGWYLYSSNAATQRQAQLTEAIRIYNGVVGEPNSPFIKSYKTQAEKDAAATKALTELANKGHDEGAVARFYLGVMHSDAGRYAEAEREWKQVIDKGDKDYASQAKFSLAQLYAATGKPGESEKLLRDLMNNPTILVSKEQAQIELGHVLAKTNPAEARKLLEPLRTERSAVSRMAISALSEIR
jgi:tetratricopeptide (TPR) repeat protein